MSFTKQTPLFDDHVNLGARMVDFSGWQMPIQYPKGIVAEHLAVRTHAGIFDVSHMGRFRITGQNAVPFLQAVLTNDCSRLKVSTAHYSILANDNGGAIDDVFLYHEPNGDFLLVVNASNCQKDWDHLQEQVAGFDDVILTDVSEDLAMIAIQGPSSESLLNSLISQGQLPESKRNSVGCCKISGTDVLAARTGYTGEKVCFELFVSSSAASGLWSGLVNAGAEPIGLGARDTLRLEAGLPLYGHELGLDAEGNEIPVFAIPQAKFAISLEGSREFIGRSPIEKQANAIKAYAKGDYSDISALPKVLRQFRLNDKGIAREGSKVFLGDNQVGVVTSGTMVPRIKQCGPEKHIMRAIGLCMVSPHLHSGDIVDIEVRNRRLTGILVDSNFR